MSGTTSRERNVAQLPVDVAEEDRAAVSLHPFDGRGQLPVQAQVRRVEAARRGGRVLSNEPARRLPGLADPLVRLELRPLVLRRGLFHRAAPHRPGRPGR